MISSQHITHQLWLDHAIALLKSQYESAVIDARVILCHGIGKPLSFILAWPESNIESDVLLQLNHDLQRRLEGLPISYITGSKEFWSMQYKVTPDVLIPRPETEMLVEWALEKTPDEKIKYKVLDLGTGSGAIAIALAKERAAMEIIATDISSRALILATENAQLNQCTNITFIQGSWFEPISEKQFDLIISNPPYIDEADGHLKQGDVAHEPRQALVSANNGFSDIQSIISTATKYLKSGGDLCIEHGYEQAETVRKMMHLEGYHQIHTSTDLSGNERFTTSQWGY